MKASFKKYTLQFKRPAGTSRGIMNFKETWFLILEESGKTGIGECGMLKGLSIDDRPDYEDKLKWLCDNIHLGEKKLREDLVEFPSIQFGLETAFISLRSENPFLLFPSDFTLGHKKIHINGLVWMGDEAFMKAQIEEKIQQGFSCIKMKIGAIDFDKELSLLKFIRQNFGPETIEIRVDANGAFSSQDALDKINKISGFQLHSIEQPIGIKHHDMMAVLAKSSKIPIALDEELIGIDNSAEKDELLRKIMPQYIILKPSLIGGFRAAEGWISIAEKYNIGWWITSALESNIGLNAISQWTYKLNNPMPQGLGTGSLYTNNFESPLEVSGGMLGYNAAIPWQVDELFSGS